MNVMSCHASLLRNLELEILFPSPALGFLFLLTVVSGSPKTSRVSDNPTRNNAIVMMMIEALRELINWREKPRIIPAVTNIKIHQSRREMFLLFSIAITI